MVSPDWCQGISPHQLPQSTSQARPPHRRWQAEVVATCAFLAWGLEGAADLLER